MHEVHAKRHLANMDPNVMLGVFHLLLSMKQRNESIFIISNEKSEIEAENYLLVYSREIQ